MIDVDEMLTWLHGQIDPHDSRNPKYATLWKQIDAIRQAKANIMAAQPPKPIIVRGKLIDCSQSNATADPNGSAGSGEVKSPPWGICGKCGAPLLHGHISSCEGAK